MAQLDPSITEQMADTVDVISKAAVGMRAALIRGGFEEGAAQFMAIHFFNHIVDAVFAQREQGDSR